MVVDSSVVIAVLRSEPLSERVANRLKGAAISAVNLAEIIAHAVRSGTAAAEIRDDIANLQVVVHAFDDHAAMATGSLIAKTKHLGLSLGDRACLALAQQLRTPVLTADRVWTKLDVGIRIETIR